MTKLMEGKKGIIFGVSNKRGIGYAIAEQLHKQGAEIAFTYANDLMETRVKPIAEEMESKLVLECDVTREDHLESVFKAYKETYKQSESCHPILQAWNGNPLVSEITCKST